MSAKATKLLVERTTALRANLKGYAREFLIDFADYRPFARTEKAGKQRPAAKYDLAA